MGWLSNPRRAVGGPTRLREKTSLTSLWARPQIGQAWARATRGWVDWLMGFEPILASLSHVHGTN